MKNAIFLLMFILLSSVHAKDKYRIGVGATLSYFVNAENSAPLAGYLLRAEIRLYRFRNLSIYSGIGYSVRGALLRHRTIAPSAPFPMKAYYWDIYCRIGYLDLPFSLNVSIPITSKFHIGLLFGMSFAFPLKDLSDFKRLEFFDIYELDIDNPEKYDFSFEQESTFRRNLFRKFYGMGLLFRYNLYGIKIIYHSDKLKEYYIDSMWRIPYQMRSFLIVLFVQF